MAIKISRVRQARYVTHLREMRIACKISVGKPKEKRQLGKASGKWLYNINIDLKQT
jgi:hypothetical protein